MTQTTRVERDKRKLHGEKNPSWKGMRASILAIHEWFGKNYGKPKKCQNCGAIGRMLNGRWSVEWAIKRDTNYSRDVNDYLQLCKPCHTVYDLKVKRTDFGKECTHCGTLKKWSEFSVSKAKKDGHVALCKECDKKQAKEYYRKHYTELNLTKA